MPAPLSKRELFEQVRDAIYASDWNLLYEEAGFTHPFKLRIFRDTESYGLLIYIWSLTHGGGAARPKNEQRIQMTGVVFPLQVLTGYKTLLLGWQEKSGVFVGFDTQKHRYSVSRSPSIQVHDETIEQTKSEGLAFQRKGNDEIAVAFKAELFADYVVQHENLHQMASAPEEMELIRKSLTEEPLPNELFESIVEPRRKVVRTASEWLRQGSFRTRVLMAYERHCAICDVQLDLLDAAHIVPVENIKSTDQTCNGMALCKNHHRAYDRLLLKVDEHYRISLYQKKVEVLRSKGQIGGLESFLSLLRQEIRLPSSQADRPRPQYLRSGIEIRERQLGFSS